MCRHWRDIGKRKAKSCVTPKPTDKMQQEMRHKYLMSAKSRLYLRFRPFMPALTVSILLLFCFCCGKSDCHEIPTGFSSYQEALDILSHSNFKVQDKILTTKSSWILSATFLSCDGETGYFILETGSKKYIHNTVPFKKWLSFKNAKSFGSFYNHYIKKKYHLVIE